MIHGLDGLGLGLVLLVTDSVGDRGVPLVSAVRMVEPSMESMSWLVESLLGGLGAQVRVGCVGGGVGLVGLRLG